MKTAQATITAYVVAFLMTCLIGPSAAADGESCELLRPYMWQQGDATCIEGPTTPIILTDGEAYRAEAVDYGFSNSGVGYAHVFCYDGELAFGARNCRRLRVGGWVTP